MEQRFKTVLNNLSSNEEWSHTILAVSGGIDSVVMAYLYRECDRPFSIAHCNFQLREEESMRDEEFVISLGEKMGIKVLVERFETEKYANENGVSIQMAARDLRYNWFKELSAEFEANIAIAHHANDIAETMIFNLAKGTGLAGLHGIADTDGIFVRPLLWARKEEIVDFAQVHSIEWCDDHSNESEKYMRNIIRKKVVPELERVNPSFITTNLRNAARIKDAENFMHYAIDQLKVIQEKGGHIYINKEALLKLPGSRAVLYQLIKSYGFSYEQVVSIEQSAGGIGAIFLSPQWVLNVDREYFIISKNKQSILEQLVDESDQFIELEAGSLQLTVLSAEPYEIMPDSKIAALDFDKLTFPLLIRNWRPGDYFIPLGMHGKKKVSDFMIDEKVPVNLKPKILVMISGNDIVWVVGHRINENYKITPGTRRIYEVKKVSE